TGLFPGAALESSSTTGASISADGKHVAFVLDDDGTPELATYDRDADGNGVLDQPNSGGIIRRVAHTIPIPTTAFPLAFDVSLSGDGHIVAVAGSVALPSGRLRTQIWTVDRAPATAAHPYPFDTAADRRITQVTRGDDDSFAPSTSRDGRYIAFTSLA